MGSCDSCKRPKENNGYNNNNTTTAQVNSNKPIDKKIKNQCIVDNTKFKKPDPYILNVSKSICKIEIETSSGKIRGSGFLLKFYIDQELFYYLVSNEHVLTKAMSNNNNIIIFRYDAEFRSAKIKLDKKERYIKSFKDIDLDITFVEILDKDGISKDYFLSHESVQEDNRMRLIDRNIYIPQYDLR